MTKNILIATAALILGFSSTAIAGGLAPVEVPVAEVIEPVTWTGFYTGVQYGVTDIESFEVDTDEAGIIAGYRHDFGSIVLGGELVYNVGSEDINTTVAKAQLGYDFGNILTYATVGYTVVDFDVETVLDEYSVYGAGVDYAVSDSVVIGVEYLTNTDDSDSETWNARVAYRF